MTKPISKKSSAPISDPFGGPWGYFPYGMVWVVLSATKQHVCECSSEEMAKKICNLRAQELGIAPD